MTTHPKITVEGDNRDWRVLEDGKPVLWLNSYFEAHTLRLQMEIAADVAAIRGMMEERR